MKDLLEFHIIEYPEKSGQKYKFDPYVFGRGAWRILYSDNREGRYVPSSLQKTLNQYFFKRKELPSLYERFKQSTPENRKQLKDISIAWLQLKIKALRQNSELSGYDILKERTTFSPGQMYLYFYDAKHKDTLPKWDSLPLTIMLERRADSFLGLNLHYLSMNERSVFLGKMLQSNSVYNKANDVLKVNVKYSELKNSKNYYKGYEVCVKEYLYTHIHGKILPIDSHEWLYAILLPLENFHYNR